MIINHNLNSMNAHRNMSFNTAQTGKAMEKLSSGLRINRAGDDAAGLAISEKMRGQIRGLDMGAKNAQDGISLIQTAEGALNETHSILQRMRELAVQGSNDTNTLTDRKELQKEFNQLIEEVDRISTDTEFNTKKLLNGAADVTSGVAGAADLNFHIGANAGQTLVLSISQMDSSTLGTTGIGDKLTDLAVVDVDDVATTTGGLLDGSNAAITVVNDAIEMVSAERSKLGANQNRLEHTINNLSTSAENLQAAESRIRDVDMAKEMMNFTKNNILNQAAQAMMAQSNQQPQAVLQLLR
ncbi:flagellin [Exiguobacterium sp. SH1S21]|uniref:flagellin Hag n=1 Tax=Exiguobacterium sp. SH1S21 TaxID=2510953 RepID=UPI00103C941F|nr:flagellin Hag [Exiguobacterium sp. SH1S21]TCI57197.1 flagellin [Exiguobacterium sp. SH1S21]